MDTGSNVIFGINPNINKMEFLFHYDSGINDILTLKYLPRFSYQNQCDFQVYIDSFEIQFTKNNIFKNITHYKSPNNRMSSRDEQPNGYTFEFY